MTIPLVQAVGEEELLDQVTPADWCCWLVGGLRIIILQSRKGDRSNFIDTTKILRPLPPPFPGDKQ